MSVKSWSIVGRQAVECRSRVGRDLVDSRSSVGRVSVERAINYGPSIGRYFVDTPRPNIGHMSVSCRWHIGQLSVAYQSCVNLAGESNGFPFERLRH